ncbi:MAG TPA: hypothetical protein VJJ83_03130, partial [Candidatus Babeliales bacterium]|nr:hypothetical protein [Candidatus Babeliales bacterium]
MSKSLYNASRLSLYLILATALFGCQHTADAVKLSTQKVQIDGQLTPIAQDIFKRLEIKEAAGLPVTTLKAANALAQAQLLRDEKSERWHTQAATTVRARMQTERAGIMADLKQLGLINEVPPAKNKYTYALVMGATISTVKQRLEYLTKLLQAGYVFDNIVLLGGERPLNPNELTKLAELTAPATITTEATAMQFIYDAEPTLKQHQVLLINAPMTKKADGTLVRPNTDDTVIAFAKSAPAVAHPGACLVISNNPYIIRQTAVVKRLLPQDKFPTDGAGSGIASADTADIVMLMDEFA